MVREDRFLRWNFGAVKHIKESRGSHRPRVLEDVADVGLIVQMYHRDIRMFHRGIKMSLHDIKMSPRGIRTSLRGIKTSLLVSKIETIAEVTMLDRVVRIKFGQS